MVALVREAPQDARHLPAHSVAEGMAASHESLHLPISRRVR